ncbi:unnamed protein product [Eruca vesicaria subsp. sativa]|uniref:Gamma-glutamylcyclotransferase n=1 Tax=Eruca vesicaria subsp. sativa TaxID=29727 RepID=A0ABC8L3C1_ERUVS|nr:unnamed protein product [Eruca vesicaria subsp. sativa]
MVLWVFGYGSLIWNSCFDFDEKLIGYIKTTNASSILLVLIIEERLNILQELARWSNPLELYWGAAYCVRGGPEKEKLAMEYLERIQESTDTFEPILTGVIVYVCNLSSGLLFFKIQSYSQFCGSLSCVALRQLKKKVSNKYYLGPAPLEEIAMQIATGSGPCRNNREYLFKLERAMHDIEHEETAKLIKRSEGIVEACGYSCAHQISVSSSCIHSSTAPCIMRDDKQSKQCHGAN